jgi:hypothetical protein
LIHVSSLQVEFPINPVTNREIQAVLVEEFPIYFIKISDIHKDLILDGSKQPTLKIRGFLKWDYVYRCSSRRRCDTIMLCNL